MRVLITGGTGFVGGWTAKAISDAGHAVRFLVRNPDKLHTTVAKLGVDVSDFVVADITDRVAVRGALRGCDAVVHSAALVATDPRQTAEMLATNMQGAQNVLGQSVELGLDPIVHVSSFTALFHPDLETLTADLPVVGGADGYGTSKAQVEIYARGLQDAGAPVNITYPGMVLGPPVGDQFGEAGEGVRAALQIHAIPGRSAAWLIVDVRDLAALHAALLEPGRGPRRYTAGGHRVAAADLANLLGQVAETPMVAVPIPDTALRVAGAVLDRANRFLPFETPFTWAGMQYYTQMPASDDSPSERELGISYRDPHQTVADTFEAIRAESGWSPSVLVGGPDLQADVHLVDAAADDGVRVEPRRVVPVPLEDGVVDASRFGLREHPGYGFDLIALGLAQRPALGDRHPRSVVDSLGFPRPVVGDHQQLVVAVGHTPDRCGFRTAVLGECRQEQVFGMNNILEAGGHGSSLSVHGCPTHSPNTEFPIMVCAIGGYSSLRQLATRWTDSATR